jgi:hypothetical protein
MFPTCCIGPACNTSQLCVLHLLYRLKLQSISAVCSPLVVSAQTVTHLNSVFPTCCIGPNCNASQLYTGVKFVPLLQQFLTRVLKELPSDHHLPAKLVQTFADRGVSPSQRRGSPTEVISDFYTETLGCRSRGPGFHSRSCHISER